MGFVFAFISAWLVVKPFLNFVTKRGLWRRSRGIVSSAAP